MTNLQLTELESLKYSLQKEESKHVNKKDWDYIILLEKCIKRIENKFIEIY
jgi:hypothetical protein